MDNSPFSQSITKLIAESISLTNQVTKHFEVTQVLSEQGDVPFQHMAKLYDLIIEHQNKVKKASYFLVENLPQEVAHVVVGKDSQSSNVKRMPNVYKEPLLFDFDSLVEQAVSYQKASLYTDLNKDMQWALAIAALREDKTLAVDAEFIGFNQLLAKVFESKGSQESLQKLYGPELWVL